MLDKGYIKTTSSRQQQRRHQNFFDYVREFFWKLLMALRTLPYFSINVVAVSSSTPVSAITMRTPRPTSLRLDNCISTILFPLTRPRRIITEVLIIFNTSFCAVPAFIRVDPVTNSGPTMTSMGYLASAATGEFALQTMQPVAIPCLLASRRPPIT